jgi:hypothetical protein
MSLLCHPLRPVVLVALIVLLAATPAPAAVCAPLST